MKRTLQQVYNISSRKYPRTDLSHHKISFTFSQCEFGFLCITCVGIVGIGETKQQARNDAKHKLMIDMCYGIQFSNQFLIKNRRVTYITISRLELESIIQQNKIFDVYSIMA